MSVVYINDYLKNADGENLADAFRKALVNSDNNGTEIIIEKQIYNIYPDNLQKRDIFVSNTNSEDEGDITRIFGMLLENKKNVHVRGNGAVILMHGKFTQIGIIKSENITFENLTLNTCHPTVAEMQVTDICDDYLDCAVNGTSLYKISDGHIVWYGENYSFTDGISQIYDPISGITRRAWGPMQDKDAVFREIASNKIRIYYGANKKGNPYGVKKGDYLQMRNPLRDDCGILISDSHNICFKNVTVNYMHGMGFIAQNSSNISADGFSAFPDNGRTNSCFADVMHFSGCRGKIEIKNGRFIGAQDDAVNVHGTHLKIIEKSGPYIAVRFEHPQTVGIGGFSVGDNVACVNPDTLLRVGVSKLAEVCEISPRIIKLKLAEDSDLFREGYVLENLSAYPQVYISDNYFERIPTRGILVSSSEKTVIKNNTFNKIKGCGILIADDAKSWFESGPVRDVEIKNNKYTDSDGCFVKICPENSCHEAAVHKNIRITENEVALSAIRQGRKKEDGAYFVTAKSTDKLEITGNIIKSDSDKCIIELTDCYEVNTDNNLYCGKIEELHNG